jgi:Holliday junction resolvase RusA-like endonuclease
MIVLTLSSLPTSTNASNAVIMAKRKDGKIAPRRIKTKSFRAWIVEAGQEIMIQRQKPIEGSVLVDIEVRRTNARSDVDNIIKGLLDLLVEHRLISDDRKVNRVSATWLDNEAAPPCKVTVVPSA